MKKLFNTLVPSPALFVAALLFLLLSQSCYRKNKLEVAAPERLISHDSMVMILTDLQLAEGVVSFEKLNRVNKKNLKQTYYQKVLDHYGITAGQLHQNMDYYNMKFDEIASIYDEVIKRLTLMQEKIKREEEQRKKEREKKKKKEKRAPSPQWLKHPPRFQSGKEGTPMWLVAPPAGTETGRSK